MKGKFPMSDFPEKARPDIEAAIAAFEKMEELAQGANLDAAAELEEGFGEFKKQMDEAARLLTRVVKLTGDDKAVDALKAFWKGKDFWKSMEGRISQATRSWFELAFLREEEEEEQKALLRELFDFNYVKRETIVYTAQKTERKEEEIKAVFRMFAFCEEILAIQQVSHRRFRNLLVELSGFSRPVADCLWDLYQESLPVIEKHAFAACLGILMKKTASLDQSVARVEAGMDMLAGGLEELVDSFSGLLDILAEEE